MEWEQPLAIIVSIITAHAVVLGLVWGVFNKRFKDINKRFEDMNRRIDDINRRLDRLEDEIREIRQLLYRVFEIPQRGSR
ncbi:MAG: hypothetical protein D6674_06260 [Acidobacteria bacterium]|jgi:nitrogen fixation-related uncharacterized protein|nr:MAG: hypothetical protein D6674_06260 [Acidobacteriota bacterium]